MTYRLHPSFLAARAEYVAHFRRVIASVRATHREAVVELMLLVGDGSNPHASRFNLPLRIDVVSGTPQQPALLAAELDAVPSFLPQALALPSGRVATLRPFAWHACDVLFQGPTDDWAPVLSWFDSWFDRAETLVPDDLGLSGVIHSMTEPVSHGSGSLFTVDFGSAPVAAFEDLATTLDSLALSQLTFGTVARNSVA